MFRKRLSGKLNQKVDLQVFNILPIKIKNEIAKKHRILYQKETFNNTDFILKNIKNYFSIKG